MNAMIKLYARTGVLPAIAAALALSSTPAFTQQAQPAPTEPAPASSTPTAPATDPLAPDPAASVPATTTSTTTKTTTVKHAARTHATTAKAPPPVTHAARPVATRPAAPAAAPVAAAPAQPAVAPVVDLSAQPAPKPAAAKPASSTAENLLPYAAGALALLALVAIAAVVASRRRRRRDQEAADEETMAYEPFETAPVSDPEPVIHDEQPRIVAPSASAFAWGTRPEAREDASAAESTADRDDRRPGETWVERAYRGPSPNNPSASLRNRLSRAAFFDKRERDVAAGLAEPIDPDAGLPNALVEEQDRELA